MTLTTSLRKDRRNIRRIVTVNVVGETSVSYNGRAIDTPELAVEFWKSHVATAPDFEPDKETMVVVLTNTRLCPIAWHRVSLGTVSEVNAHPREILRPVIACAAYGFVLMHNHPSGDASPSRADEQVTRRINEAADLMQVRLLDHIIVGLPAPGRSAYYSFREAGIIR